MVENHWSKKWVTVGQQEEADTPNECRWLTYSQKVQIEFWTNTNSCKIWEKGFKLNEFK